jgi:CRP-like cAMP-binding protein
MFLDQPRSATLKAASPASVLTLDYRHFKHFLLAFPETIFALFEKCVHRLDAQQLKTAKSDATAEVLLSRPHRARKLTRL